MARAHDVGKCALVFADTVYAVAHGVEPVSEDDAAIEVEDLVNRVTLFFSEQFKSWHGSAFILSLEGWIRCGAVG